MDQPSLWRIWLSYIIYYWGGMHRYVGLAGNLPREHRVAIRYFRLAYIIDPSFARARLDRAALLWRELKEFEAALIELEGVLEVDPRHGGALFQRAQIRQEQGDFHTAVDDWRLFLQLVRVDDPYYDYYDTAVRQLSTVELLLADLTSH